MIRFNQSPEYYFSYLNVERGRIFTAIIVIFSLFLLIAIDPLILDLTLLPNQLIRLSHFVIAIISVVCFLFVLLVKSNKIADLGLAIYLILFSAIETYVSGAIDTLANRGPSVFIATIFLIGFLFSYSNRYFIAWFFFNFILFITLALFSGANQNQLINSIGNGTIFTSIIFLMRIYTHKRKIVEYENQMRLIRFIVKSNVKKEKPLQTNFNDKNDELLSKLEVYIIQERNYLKSDITLSSVATELGTNTKYLSQLINSNYHMNFNAFINDFRVAEAKRIMSHKLGNIITIEAISQQAGFKSKSSFYTAFKNSTGLIPSEFIKHHVKK